MMNLLAFRILASKPEGDRVYLTVDMENLDDPATNPLIIDHVHLDGFNPKKPLGFAVAFEHNERPGIIVNNQPMKLFSFSCHADSNFTLPVKSQLKTKLMKGAMMVYTINQVHWVVPKDDMTILIVAEWE